MRKTNRPLTVAGLMLALFMGALEATVVATAMPTVIGELHGLERYAWVFTAYLLCSTVPVPIYGKLADLYGRKPVLLFGIAVFLVGSIASGAATSMTQLIAFRALQGLGAGSMQPVAITIVGDIFDLEERAKMQGLFGAAWGVAGLVGPMVGGLIVKLLSWRWVFYVNVPVGLLAALLVGTQLHETVEKKRHGVDVAGALLLASGVVALLVAAQGGDGTKIALALFATVALFTAFTFVERRHPSPILPLGLFARPLMANASLAGAIIGGAMICTLTYVPLFVQGVLGGSPTDAGSTITPMVIGWPIASAISGRLITKVGFRPLVRIGLGVTAVAAVLLAWLARGAPTENELRVATTLFGVGMGFANTALVIAVQTSVSWEERGVATASTMFSRTIGGTLAVGACGGVLAAAIAADPSIPSDAASRVLAPHAPDAIELAPGVAEHVAHALAGGLGEVFVIVAAMGAVAFLVSLRFPHVEARAGSATPAASASEPSAATPPATKNAALGKAS